MLNISNSSVTLDSDALAMLGPAPVPSIGASAAAAAPSLLQWDGRVHINGDVRWVSKGAHRIVVNELKADSSSFTWGNMTLVKETFSLTECNVSGQVTVDEQASLSVRNSKFDREVQVKGHVRKCDVKTHEGIGCAKATVQRSTVLGVLVSPRRERGVSR
jgi:hypothetical protein